MRDEQVRHGQRSGDAGVENALGDLGGEHLVKILANVVVGDGPGRANREQAVEKAAQFHRRELGERGGRRERSDITRLDGLGGEVLREADQTCDVGTCGERHALRLTGD